MADQQRPQGLLKFQVHHWKQENVSDEEFAKWYTDEFIPRSVKILRNYGVEQYKLVSPSFRHVHPFSLFLLRNSPLGLIN